MAITSLDKTIWSERFDYNLQKDLVFGNIVNTNWEGDARKGSTVKINSTGAVIARTYVPGTDLVRQVVSSSASDLDIDQYTYINAEVEDLSSRQWDVNLVEMYMSDGAYQVAETVDEYISTLSITGTVSASADVQSIGTVAQTAASSSAYDQLVDLSVLLDENNVKKQNRFAVISPWYLGVLQKDTRWNTHMEVLTNGVTGNKIAGMEIYVSNNCQTTGTATYIVAGHRDAIAYAGVLDTLEAYRPEDAFSDAFKGLFVYGAKLVKSTALAFVKAEIYS